MDWEYETYLVFKGFEAINLAKKLSEGWMLYAIEKSEKPKVIKCKSGKCTPLHLEQIELKMKRPITE